ncbi:MAG: shikimate dehydrogenase [Candidatus Promineofilum sp.]|nr:shikimate dehydrogenase [Promineifilum sp.]
MITAKTQLTGLLGWPISHSVSPAMHNAAAAALGLDWAYVPLPVRPEALTLALGGLAALGLRGVNVTVPHKAAVLPLPRCRLPGSPVIGAVNTIVVGDGRLTGFNTDWSGFLADLEAHGVALGGRDCLVLGAGGSARAVVYALATAGGRVTVLARRPEQAAQLVQELGEALPEASLTAGALPAAAEIAGGVYHPVIVNTTPLGMAGANAGLSPWPAAPLPADAFVYDLVYNPPLTPLLQQAQAAGARAANGLGMLVNQAAEAFELWDPTAPDREVMRRAVEL